MPKLLLTYILTLFTLISCKQENKNISVEKPKTAESDFLVNFPQLNKKERKKYQKKIKHFYNQKINQNDFSGGFLVAKDGQILFQDYEGYSNYKSKEKISDKTPLHLASVSKVLTAAIVLRFVDEGKISLDDTFKKYFPDFPYEEVTIKTLLNHRSGLRNYAYFTDNDSIWDKSKDLTNKAILDILNSKKIDLDFKTDTKFSYCNTNYALLALLIEKISGQTYAEAMKNLLFEPLEMKNTFVLENRNQIDSISQSYKSDWDKIPFDFLDFVYGDKNIYSTPQDLLKFDLATYSDKFFSKELRNEIFKGYSYEKPGIKNYGLGIRLYEWDNDKTMFYHNGWWHGNNTSYITLKEEKVTIIALSNKYNKKVYQTRALTSIFGDYPFETEED